MSRIKRIARRIKRSKEKQKMLSPYTVKTWVDRDKSILFVNDPHGNIYDGDSEGKTQFGDVANTFSNNDVLAGVLEKILNGTEEEFTSSRNTYMTPSGEERIADTTIRKLYGGATIDIRVHDKSEIKDELTELYNRNFFEHVLFREISKAMREKQPVSFVSIDLGEFKKVNDTYGHDIGDKVLKETAVLLTRNTRRGDYVARISGDEFVVLCPDTDEKGAERVKEKLLYGQVNHNEYISDDILKIKMDIGMETRRFAEDVDPEEVVKRMRKEADIKMYEEKRRSKEEKGID
ncbi:MAG: GGDEF domain-containing protein [Candidatus Woesearchaeota archaeon]|jgi:diguanylate cyclase (GGDEF)-like protein|nr:GGDEF domain-containing protein [Candidatus Woesearchaeota archaeon]